MCCLVTKSEKYFAKQESLLWAALYTRPDGIAAVNYETLERLICVNCRMGKQPSVKETDRLKVKPEGRYIIQSRLLSYSP
jgi:hypothetical protein